MNKTEEYEAIFEKFPELLEATTVYEKEVLAHFGLLFSAFANLEAGVQLCFVLWELEGKLRDEKIKDQTQWVSAFDQLETEAFKLTFGSLIKKIEGQTEVKHLLLDLRNLKSARDYFAHHFFRNENDKMFSNEAMLNMMWRMHILREQVEDLEEKISQVSHSALNRIYPNRDFRADVEGYMETLRKEYGDQPNEIFGWEKPAN